MQLYLSAEYPWNTNYCTEEGQVIYKVESNGPAYRTMKVSRIIPSKINTEATDEDEALRDTFTQLGEIDYHMFRTSRIRYGEQDTPVDEYFRKGEMGFFGRDRIFKAPDGKEYAWQLTSRVCKLVSNDTSKTPVAVFHRKKFGILREDRPASLEIFPMGEAIANIIVLTFVYMEKMRKDREIATITSS